MFKDSIGEGPFQITYAFPWDTRNNITGLGKYGVDGMTFARLYDFLCTAYNHGERFVDTYFQKQFPNSAAGRLFRAVNLELRDGVDAEYGEKYASALRRKATKEGRPNMTTTEGIQLKKFSVFRAGHTKSELKRLRGAVKAEIVQYLSTGSIQLKFTGPSPLTLLRRAAAGITSSVGFYATGLLINSIQLDIRLPEESLAA
jgi:hypothetical protein